SHRALAGGSGRRAGHRRLDVALDDAPGGARSPDRAEVEAALGGEAAGERGGALAIAGGAVTGRRPGAGVLRTRSAGRHVGQLLLRRCAGVALRLGGPLGHRSGRLALPSAGDGGGGALVLGAGRGGRTLASGGGPRWRLLSGGW